MENENSGSIRQAQYIDSDLAVCSIIMLEGISSLHAVKDSKVQPDMFDGNGKIVFSFICDYYTEYGKIPTSDTVYTTTGLRWGMNADEPLDYYLDKIYERGMLVKMARGIKDISGSIRNRDVHTAITSLKSMALDIDSVQSNGATLDINYAESAGDRRDRYAEIAAGGGGIVGIPFPWPTLNDITGGIEKADLITMVARTGLGKTFLLCYMAAHFIKSGYKVLLVSKEMSPERLSLRIDSILSRLPHDSIRRGVLSSIGEKDRYEKFLSEVEKNPLYKNLDILSTVSAQGTLDLDYRIVEYQPDIVLIDGIYIMRGKNPRAKKHEQIDEVIQDLKFLAQKHNTPIIGTSQFTREMANTRSVERLKGGLSDIGGSYAISQWSDVIVAVYQNDELKKNNRMILRVIKSRHGEVGEDVPLVTNYRTMEFKDLQKNIGIPVENKMEADNKNRFHF